MTNTQRIRSILLTIDLQEAKRENIVMDMRAPDTNDKKHGNEYNKLWLEAWQLMHNNLTNSITLARGRRWTDRYALYSTNGSLIKSTQDFINAITILFDKEDHETKKNGDVTDVQQITLLIKVEQEALYVLR